MPGAGQPTVDVWWARVSEAQPRFAELLDRAERDRLAAYRREDDRNRFLLGCAILRHALGRQLDLPPSRVRLDRTCPDCPRPHGKVRLADPAADGPQMSVSHSGSWVVVAIHRGGAVGVDVERVQPGLDTAGLGRIVLAPAEERAVAELPEDRRPAAFTRLWCRKEAVVKLTGDGLRTGLAEVEVSGHDRPAALLRWPRHVGLADRVVLHDLTVDPTHAACLAVEAPVDIRAMERRAAVLFVG